MGTEHTSSQQALVTLCFQQQSRRLITSAGNFVNIVKARWFLRLRSPSQPRQLLIKRLLALEGDWISVPGRVEIAKIPKGHCWVEGDNPGKSEDSHNKYGSVPIALLEGRVPCTVWPVGRARAILSYVPRGRLLAKNDGAFKDDEIY